MVALFEKIHKPPSVEILEMLAISVQQLLFKKWVCTNHIPKATQRLASKHFKNGDMLLSSFGHLVKNTIVCASSLRSFSFYHTKGQGNVVAHTLA